LAEVCEEECLGDCALALNLGVGVVVVAQKKEEKEMTPALVMSKGNYFEHTKYHTVLLPKLYD
jgi:hypothetical protein